MPTQVLICDDSSFARKQMAMSLPKSWDVEVHFAENGREGLKQILSGKGDILFLDLNMPVMDGYEVLQVIQQKDLPTMVIVCSGDIQPEAKIKVMNYGALDFIKKPIGKEKLLNLLEQYGIYKEGQNEAKATENNQQSSVAKAADFNVDLRDCYQEIANIAMGQAADLLARLLNAFVLLPIPNVNLLEREELHMALAMAEQDASLSAVCQGFIGSGIAGEALLIFNDSSFSDIASLMKYKGEINKQVELELLMDIASILIGAFINGVANQLDMTFSQGHPVVLGQHCQASELIKTSSNHWKKTLTIEVNYTIENHNINCDLLILFTEDSIENLNQKVSLLLEHT